MTSAYLNALRESKPTKEELFLEIERHMKEKEKLEIEHERAWYSREDEHRRALVREEEKGFVRGVEEMREIIRLAEAFVVRYVTGYSDARKVKGVILRILEKAREARPEEIPELVDVAAIRYDGITYTVPRPYRHHNVIWLMRGLGGFGPEAVSPKHQGFLTTKGRFVDREEALKIAIAGDQVIVKYESQTELYSEDMW